VEPLLASELQKGLAQGCRSPGDSLRESPKVCLRGGCWFFLFCSFCFVFLRGLGQEAGPPSTEIVCDPHITQQTLGTHGWLGHRHLDTASVRAMPRGYTTTVHAASTGQQLGPGQPHSTDRPSLSLDNFACTQWHLV